MEKITVEKAGLVAILKKNREAHGRIFEEALDGYFKQTVKELEEHIERLRKGERVSISIERVAPRDHTRDYDRALGMVEMAIGETIELSETDYKFYVDDDWGWQAHFAESAKALGSRTSRSKFGDRYDADSGIRF